MLSKRTHVAAVTTTDPACKPRNGIEAYWEFPSEAEAMEWSQEFNDKWREHNKTAPHPRWAHPQTIIHPTYLITGVDKAGKRFKISVDNPTMGRAHNVWKGSLWEIIDGKRKRIHKWDN